MNVMKGRIFANRQKVKKTANQSLFSSRFGSRNNTMGCTSSVNTATKSTSNTPKYPFEGILNTSESNSNSMGPPLQPPPLSRPQKRRASSSNDVTESSNKSARNPTQPTVLGASLSGQLWTPKYGRLSMQQSNSTSRGLVSGSRSKTTPFSSTSNTTMADSCIILAISEGRGAARGEVGIAAIDLRRPRLTLCQLSDRHSYLHTLTTIHFFNPVEIIIPNTFCEGLPTELYRVMKSHFPNIVFTPIQRKFFCDSQGLQLIQRLCAPEYSSIQLQLIHKFYALVAAAALLKYVEYIQCIVFQPNSLKIEYHCSENSTLIDVETAIRLELVESLSGCLDRGSSMLSILNQSYTAGGLRALRATILQPSCHPDVISTRLDCVQELLENADGLMPSLQSIMKQLYDVDKILWLCMELPGQVGVRAGEAQLNHTLQLKTTMALVPALIAALHSARGAWFHKIKKDFEDPKLTEITERIKRVIQDDVHVGHGAAAQQQRCFAVRPEINGLLDVARRSYTELVSDLGERVQLLADSYGLPIHLHNNASRGFHVVMLTGFRGKRIFNVADLPPIFIEVQNHGGRISMTTEDIVLLDQQARESINEIQTMSNIVIFGLLSELRPYMSVLYKLCEDVAELDVILSLAQVSSVGHYVRPRFNSYTELKESIHPMLDYLTPVVTVPNDVFATPEYNFQIITGPNMGGKTIYIKQIALLQIMAQIGCYVPATSAVFRIADRIFSRIGFNDSIECNASTYVLEMKEMHYILQTITPTSLVIVDELCRGTSSEEGTSMAWAICERLLDTDAFTFFTTHFLQLTKLQDLYFNVVNLHTKAEEVSSNEDGLGEQLVYKHKVVAGVTNIQGYGLKLARQTNLPENVIGLAEELAAIISLHRKPLPTSELKNQDDFHLYKLAADLIHMCRKPEYTDDDMNKMVQEFKVTHPKLIENIQAEEKSSKDKADNSASYNKQFEKKLSASTEASKSRSQEDPLKPIEDICRSQEYLSQVQTLPSVSRANVTEDIQASVTVSRKYQTSDTSNTSYLKNISVDQKKISNDVSKTTINNYSDDYNENSFITSSDYAIMDNRFSTKYVPSSRVQIIDINQPSTSTGIAHSGGHVPNYLSSNIFVDYVDEVVINELESNERNKYTELEDDDSMCGDSLQEYLTERMQQIFGSICISESNINVEEHCDPNVESTEQLKNILKTPIQNILKTPIQNILKTPIQNKQNAAKTVFADEEEQLSEEGSSSSAAGSYVEQIDEEDQSDVECFVQEVAESPTTQDCDL